MMHNASSRLGEVPYCFSRSSVKYEGHTALKIVEFDPDWTFPDMHMYMHIPKYVHWTMYCSSYIMYYI